MDDFEDSKADVVPLEDLITQSERRRPAAVAPENLAPQFTPGPLKQANFRKSNTSAQSASSKPNCRDVWTGSVIDGEFVFPTRTGNPGHRPTQFSHNGAVMSVCVSPCGRYVASGGDSEDRIVKLWRVESDLSRLTFVRSLGEHVEDRIREGMVECVCFSPDSRFVASGGRDDYVRLWTVTEKSDESRTTESETILGEHDSWVWSIAYAPCGSFVVTGSLDRSIRIWPVDMGRGTLQPYVVGKHEDWVTAVCISPTGNSVASAGYDGVVRMWNIDPANTRSSFAFEIDRYFSFFRSLSFSKNGCSILGGSENHTIRIWNLSAPEGFLDGAPIHVGVHVIGREIDCDHNFSVCFLPDGSGVVSAGIDKSVRIWLLDRRAAASAGHADGYTLLGWHTGPVNCVSTGILANRAYVVSCGSDKHVRIFDLQRRVDPIVDNSHSEIVTTICYTHDDRFIMSGGEDNTVRYWAIEEDVRGKVGEHGDLSVGSNDISISPDNLYAASASDDRTVTVWKLPGVGNSIKECNKKQFHVQLSSKLGDTVESVCFSPDGKFLATAEFKNVYLWATKDWSYLGILGTHETCVEPEEKVTKVRFTTDSKFVISAGDDGAVCQWNVVANYQKQQQPFSEAVLGSHKEAVIALAISPCKTKIASGGVGQEIFLWSLSECIETGQEPIVLGRHDGEICSLSFSPDATLLVSGGRDNAVRVWDIAEKKQILRWQTTSDPPLAVAFSHSGLEIAFCYRGNVCRMPFRFIQNNLFHVYNFFNTKAENVHQILPIYHLLYLPLLYAHFSFTGGNSTEKLISTIPAQAVVESWTDMELDRLWDAIFKSPHYGKAEIDPRALGNFRMLADHHPSIAVKLLASFMQQVSSSDDGATQKLPLKPNATILHCNRLFKMDKDSLSGVFESTDAKEGGEDDDEAEIIETSAGSNGSATRVSVPVEVRTAVISGFCDASALKKFDSDFLEVAADSELVDAFETTAIRILMRFRWKVVRPFFFAQLALYIIMLACATAFIMDVFDSEAELNYTKRTIGTGICTVAISCLFLIQEIIEGLSFGLRMYARDIWNYIDLSVHFLVYASALLYAFNNSYFFVVGGFAMLAMWLKLLSFSRGFAGSGMFMRMIFEVARGIRYFLVLLIVVIIAFGSANYLFFRGTVPSYATIGSALVYQFSGIAGGTQLRLRDNTNPDFLLPFADQSPLYNAQLMLYMLFILVVPVLFLNLLIALMMDVYGAINVTAASHYRMEKAKLILSLEGLFLQFLPSKKLRKDPFLHVFAPRESKIWDNGASRVTQFQKLEKHINVQTQKETAMLSTAFEENEAKMSKLLARVERLEVTVIEKQVTLESKLDKLMAIFCHESVSA
jgi:WD40 repeat protein